MERQELLDALFQHLWTDRERPDLLIRDVLVGLIDMLEREGCDFSTLEGHEDLVMWIAHSYVVGFDCWDSRDRAQIAQAFRMTFPEIDVPPRAAEDDTA